MPITVDISDWTLDTPDEASEKIQQSLDDIKAVFDGLLENVTKEVLEITKEDYASVQFGAVFAEDGSLATDPTDAASLYVSIPLNGPDGRDLQWSFKLSEVVDDVIGTDDSGIQATAESATVLRDELRAQADRIDAYIKTLI